MYLQRSGIHPREKPTCVGKQPERTGALHVQGKPAVRLLVNEAVSFAEICVRSDGVVE